MVYSIINVINDVINRLIVSTGDEGVEVDPITGIPTNIEVIGSIPPRVCEGGDGINSNTGLASAGEAAGLSSSAPQVVRDLADREARRLYPNSMQFSKAVGSPSGDLILWRLSYHIRVPDFAIKWLGVQVPNGLVIYINYNAANDTAQLVKIDGHV